MAHLGELSRRKADPWAALADADQTQVTSSSSSGALGENGVQNENDDESNNNDDDVENQVSWLEYLDGVIRQEDEEKESKRKKKQKKKEKSSQKLAKSGAKLNRGKRGSDASQQQQQQRESDDFDLNWHNGSLMLEQRELVALLKLNGPEIKDRKWHFRTWRSCFVASEFVDWVLLMGINGITQRHEAVVLGQQLIDAEAILHVVDARKRFKDAFLFFRCADSPAHASSSSSSSPSIEPTNSLKRLGSRIRGRGSGASLSKNSSNTDDDGDESQRGIATLSATTTSSSSSSATARSMSIDHGGAGSSTAAMLSDDDAYGSDDSGASDDGDADEQPRRVELLVELVEKIGHPLERFIGVVKNKAELVERLREHFDLSYVPVLQYQHPISGETVTLRRFSRLPNRCTVSLDRPVTQLSLVELARTMAASGGVEVRDRRYRLKVYPGCFVASEIVDWLVGNKVNGVQTRKQACNVGQQLVNQGFIQHVVDVAKPFKDKYLFFRFLVVSECSPIEMSKGPLSVYAWGDGLSLPRQIALDKSICAVACGATHCLALSVEGDVYSWGRGEHGQLGLGTARRSTRRPLRVEGLTPQCVISIGCGTDKSAAITETMLLFVWGHFADHEIWEPRRLLFESTRTASAAAASLRDIGAESSSGSEESDASQHSLSPSSSSSSVSTSPSKLSASLASSVKSAAAAAPSTRSKRHKLARSYSKYMPPANIDWVSLEVGVNHLAMLGQWRRAGDKTYKIYSQAFTWGGNSCGQLGQGHRRPLMAPERVRGLDNLFIAHISAGAYHMAAVSSDGRLFMWGKNTRAAPLGVPMRADGPVDCTLPTRAVGLDHERVMRAACGGSHTVCVTATGAVYAWGNNYFGQLGVGALEDDDASAANIASSSSSALGTSPSPSKAQISLAAPRRVLFDSPMYYVAAAATHTAAWTEAGELYMWGDNSRGELGFESSQLQYTPRCVTGVVVKMRHQVALGPHRSIMLCEDHPIDVLLRASQRRFGKDVFEQERLRSLLLQPCGAGLQAELRRRYPLLTAAAAEGRLYDAFLAMRAAERSAATIPPPSPPRSILSRTLSSATPSLLLSSSPPSSSALPVLPSLGSSSAASSPSSGSSSSPLAAAASIFSGSSSLLASSPSTAVDGADVFRLEHKPTRQSSKMLSFSEVTLSKYDLEFGLYSMNAAGTRKQFIKCPAFTYVTDSITVTNRLRDQGVSIAIGEPIGRAAAASIEARLKRMSTVTNVGNANECTDSSSSADSMTSDSPATTSTLSAATGDDLSAADVLGGGGVADRSAGSPPTLSPRERSNSLGGSASMYTLAIHPRALELPAMSQVDITFSLVVFVETTLKLVLPIDIKVGNAAYRSFLKVDVASEKLGSVDEVAYDEIKCGEVIGTGATGSVTKVYWRGQWIAVKHYRTATLSSPDDFKVFQREVIIASNMRHPNIVKTQGVCTTFPNLCLIFKFYPLGDLRSAIDNPNIRFTFPLIVKVALDVCIGMLHLHRFQVIHRDVKTASM
jgi:alpha-tubulin suppressor-like RCC1 family protein